MLNSLWIEHFKTIPVLNIYDSEVRDWKLEEKVSFIKVVLPAMRETEISMKKLGYLKIDRRFECYINTSIEIENFNYRFLTKMDMMGLYNEEILQIAKVSFYNDARFNFLMEYSDESYHIALKNCIHESKYKFVCIYKGELAGFILLQPNKESVMEVKLAAVTQKYRVLGIGTELYMKALDFCKEKGFQFLYGSIETINLSAINLYSYLRGKFVTVKDTYLKKVDNNGT